LDIEIQEVAMTRQYSKSASDDVARAMHERKEGTLKSGSTGKKVTIKKQAVAIGLSEARREGKKVPPPPKPGASKGAARRSKKG
jgi:hypothetical protein